MPNLLKIFSKKLTYLKTTFFETKTTFLKNCCTLTNILYEYNTNINKIKNIKIITKLNIHWSKYLKKTF